MTEPVFKSNVEKILTTKYNDYLSSNYIEEVLKGIKDAESGYLTKFGGASLDPTVLTELEALVKVNVEKRKQELTTNKTKRLKDSLKRVCTTMKINFTDDIYNELIEELEKNADIKPEIITIDDTKLDGIVGVECQAYVKKPNWWLYGAIATGAIAVIVASIILMSSNKKRKSPELRRY